MDSTTAAAMDPAYCEASPWATANLATSIIFFVPALLVVPVRMYTRLFVVRCFWWDDVSLLLAWALFVPSAAMLWQLLNIGLGRRLGCYSLDTAVFIGQRVYELTAVMTFSQMFSRISVALFVSRLFATTRGLRWALFIWTSFMSLVSILCIILFYQECTPVAALWNPALLEGAVCWSSEAKNAIQYFNGAVTIVSDILLALLPAFFFSKLRMKLKLKLALSALMASGLFSAACGFARTIMSVSFVAEDPIYNSAKLTIWGNLELESLILATAIPAIYPLFDKEKRRGDNGRYYYNNMLSNRFWARLNTMGRSKGSSGSGSSRFDRASGSRNSDIEAKGQSAPMVINVTHTIDVAESNH